MKYLFLAIVLTAVVSSISRAEEKEKEKAPKKVYLKFDDDLVQGSMTGAELFLILEKKQSKFEHLFELKNDFTDQMIHDADDIK